MNLLRYPHSLILDFFETYLVVYLYIYFKSTCWSFSLCHTFKALAHLRPTRFFFIKFVTLRPEIYPFVLIAGFCLPIVQRLPQPFWQLLATLICLKKKYSLSFICCLPYNLSSKNISSKLILHGEMENRYGEKRRVKREDIL